MDIKRHVQELRENITNNWTSTGQELSKELRGFWPASRPQSPARFSTSSNNNSPANDLARSPTGHGGANSKEFLTGYAVGLVGGVRSWVSLFSFLPLRLCTMVVALQPM
jgi:choline-phosphate cytidylyltransferase